MNHTLGFIGLGTTELLIIVIVLLLLIVAPIVLIVMLVNRRKPAAIQAQPFTPPGSPSKYFLSENGINIGPFTIGELQSRGITPETPVWINGLNNWIPAKQLPELQALFK